jgi:hypothetical protein
METTQRKGNALNEWRLTVPEETAWYEAGLSADGVKLDWYEKDSIILYGRVLLAAEMKQVIKERDEAVRQLVLVRNEYQAFFRKINNIE